jgi:hypothetical protein
LWNFQTSREELQKYEESKPQRTKTFIIPSFPCDLKSLFLAQEAARKLPQFSNFLRLNVGTKPEMAGLKGKLLDSSGVNADLQRSKNTRWSCHGLTTYVS